MLAEPLAGVERERRDGAGESFLTSVRLTTAPGWYSTSAAMAMTPSSSAVLGSVVMRPSPPAGRYELLFA